MIGSFIGVRFHLVHRFSSVSIQRMTPRGVPWLAGTGRELLKGIPFDAFTITSMITWDRLVMTVTHVTNVSFP